MLASPSYGCALRLDQAPFDMLLGHVRNPLSLSVAAPLVWTFDGRFDRCLADAEDTLRRAIVLVGDVARAAVLIELSLPALQRRIDAAMRCSRPGDISWRTSRATACRQRHAFAICAAKVISSRWSLLTGVEQHVHQDLGAGPSSQSRRTQ